MCKEALRKEYKEKRMLLTDEKVYQYSKQILNNLESLSIWDKEVYHLFLPIKKFKEVNTFPLLTKLFDLKKTVVVSRTNMQNKTLDHHKITNESIIKINQYGIPEPEKDYYNPINENEIDIVFTPLLVANTKGYRIGYGGGFYDRFFEKCRPKTLKIGLSYFSPIENNFNQAWDIPLDYLVTPNGTLNF